MNADELSQVAAQLVARVRDEDPVANQRWLHAETTAADREALLYILAAAVPTDQTWSELVAWIAGPPEDALTRRRRQWREGQERYQQRRRSA